MIRTFKDEYWIVGVTVTTMFECAWGLRGYERMLSDFALNPDLAERLLDIPYRYHLAAAKKLTRMGVDMIWIGDDMGAQHTHDHFAENVAQVSQAAHGELHRRVEGYQSRR